MLVQLPTNVQTVPKSISDALAEKQKWCSMVMGSQALCPLFPSIKTERSLDVVRRKTGTFL